VARQAADYANKELRRLQDTQPKYKGSSIKIPVAELSMQCLNMSSIAELFQENLLALGSTVHALYLRLCKWRKSGDRDIVQALGRPPTSKLSPVKKLSIASIVTRSQAHLSSAQVNAVSASLLGDVHSNRRQQRAQRRDLKKSNGVIRAVSKATGPSLLHAATSKSLQFKLYEDLEAAYKAEPSFKDNPDAIVNLDENTDPDRAGRQGHKTYGFTTVARLVKEGRQQLRTIAMPDGSGTASGCPWAAASGWLVAKTPIVKAPEGWDPGPDFRAPPHFTEPARHGGIPFLPGMGKDYFTHENTRVFCTESGVNNKECLTRMFIDFVYPLWRKRVPEPAPLLLIYDSCSSHNWTPEISQFFADKNVHVLKLYHNTTTATQAMDCGVNLQARIDTAEIQDQLMAAASFQHAYLSVDMKCLFRRPK
jgi:hypothetical protein